MQPWVTGLRERQEGRMCQDPNTEQLAGSPREKQHRRLRAASARLVMNFGQNDHHTLKECRAVVGTGLWGQVRGPRHQERDRDLGPLGAVSSSGQDQKPHVAIPRLLQDAFSRKGPEIAAEALSGPKWSTDCHSIMPSTKSEMKMLTGPEKLNPNKTGIPFQLLHLFNFWDIPVVSQHLQNKWDSKIFGQTYLKTIKLL